MSTNWIKKAIKHPGAFTAKARRAGMGVQTYAKHVIGNKDRYSGTTVRQARLARTLKGLNK